MSGRIEVTGTTQEAASAFIERHGPVGSERVRSEHEVFMLFQKFLTSASRGEASWLALGTLSVGAQPTPVVVRSVSEEENIELMVGDPDSTRFEEMCGCQAAGAIENGKVIETIQPYCEVDIAALVENLDSMMPEGLEAGYLRQQRAGDRAEQCDCADVRDVCQCGRNRICSTAELRLPREHGAVLFCDLPACGSGHGSRAVVGNDALRIFISTGAIAKASRSGRATIL